MYMCGSEEKLNPGFYSSQVPISAPVPREDLPIPVGSHGRT
jgi:hypothetical protein